MWDQHGSHLFSTWVPHGSQWDPAALTQMGLTRFPHGSHKDPQGSHMGPTWFPHASHVGPMWAFSIRYPVISRKFVRVMFFWFSVFSHFYARLNIFYHRIYYIVRIIYVFIVIPIYFFRSCYSFILFIVLNHHICRSICYN